MLVIVSTVRKGPISPVRQNHEGNCDKTTGGISTTGDNISPADIL